MSVRARDCQMAARSLSRCALPVARSLIALAADDDVVRLLQARFSLAAARSLARFTRGSLFWLHRALLMRDLRLLIGRI